ncbi:BEL1-like homeodomain protein 4 [Apostasia shenzhenica]|uniref:BEL1-like homeodomain protein 4 n=1 Tax=Apostasia shenzhenica TaxID=1088818 RepID=A0A2I0A247_9ASPA|nr:BEL1-like homeodomain protein 4 [Apostasia shenzhenica]
MGVATPPPPPPLQPFPSKPISLRPNTAAAAASMSQGFHLGGIFSFSDEFERQGSGQNHQAQQQQQPPPPQQQQQHVAQQSRRDKLRVQGLDASAVSAAGHHLMPIDEDEEEAGIYEPSGTSNMLSDLFNFPGVPAPASATDLLAGQISAAGYHRLHQRPIVGLSADWYGANRQDLAANLNSLEDAAAAVAKHQVLTADSSSAMQLFFMNPLPAAPQQLHHHQYHLDRHQRSPSPQPSATLHHHHSQPFIGGAAGPSAAAAFGENSAIIERGEVMDRQGLSLSLSSPLQQFDMGKPEELRVRDGLVFFSNQPPSSLQPQSQVHQAQAHQVHMGYGAVVNVLRNSRYSRAAQELLEEFCSVGSGQLRRTRSGRASSNPNPSTASSSAAATAAAAAAASSSTSKDHPPLSPADRFENQRKKTKLVSILDEVDRRYNHYCEQMQMVVNSFDTVMGFGAATPYTALAQKAMSRHFRCLKDSVAAQLKQTCELLGEKDAGGCGGGSGLTKGETPRLRLIDQSLRQQRAFHQMGIMDQEAWRPQRGLPERSVNVLRSWLFEHFLHPYPSDADKHLLARQTGLSRNQVSNWFINARVRLWKPMVEEMYQQEAKEETELPNIMEEETNIQSVAAAALRHHQQQQQEQKGAGRQSPESDALESDPSSSAPTPRSQQLQYQQLRFDTHPRRGSPPEDASAAAAAPAAVAAAGIENVPRFHEDMYRRAAAAAAAQVRFGGGAASGDVSLTLGLRHAGGNAPETDRFGARDHFG